MDQDLDRVRKAPLFSGLFPEELERLLAHARRRSLKAYETLFSEGDKAAAFYFIVEGSVRLYRLSPQGDEKVIEILMAGQTFGEAVVFLGGHYPVYAAALADTVLIEIPTNDFVRVLKENSGMALRMLAALSMRLHQLINDVQALTLETAGQRVAGYLLAQCPEGAAAADIHIQVHKNIVASRLGVKPETFSRVLATLREQGLITVAGNDIHIADRARLARWRDEAYAGGRS
ncbi:Crp/Fnr family transcriptional regulator [Acidiferrobacter sp.]|uniref:Crp/Fnr family transcriptional regulator n=1 Tax=Acidiferrobacter sp. TaxID=1872107 RepID=UPI0026215313|nr:Crp/Fnr family transcriptional regulator [Acidiferrobacter sp.]